MNSVAEHVLQFQCGDDHLVGVVSAPADKADLKNLGVVIVVGGPQYRVGSHRQFVSLARQMAAAGYRVLRFDVRGMGDSTGSQRSFDNLSDDVGSAISAFVESTAQSSLPLQQLALAGLCDGASAALIYMAEQADPRVVGLCLLNPWVRSEQSLAKAHVQHYYWQRLSSLAFWRKVLAGGVGLQALSGFATALKRMTGAGSVAPTKNTQTARPADFRATMLHGMKRFAGPVVLALSADDLTAQEFAGVLNSQPAWQACTQRAGVERWELAGADHTLSGSATALAFGQRVCHWLQAVALTHQRD